MIAERCDMAQDVAHSFGASYDTPFTTPKELRKILGNDAKDITDQELQQISITLGKIALLLTHNSENLGEIKNA